MNGDGPYKQATSNAKKIMDHISLRENVVIDEKTLLIFDEIQEAMPAITSLKDFKENHPEIPVIASGSLVRIKIKRKSKKQQDFFYPVGGVDELTLFPINFEEFLLNANAALYQRIVEAYQEKKPLDLSAHHLALEYLERYLLIGSLPESIALHLEGRSYATSRKNLVTTYNDYLNDIDLYGVRPEIALKTRRLFTNLYVEIQRPHAEFRPSLFDEGKKVRDYEGAMELLLLAGVIYQAKRTKEHVSLPLKEDDGSNYRIYFLDPGFLAYQSGINMADFLNGINNNMGVFYENYIACELSSYGVDLFYWKGKDDAEFEFLVREGDEVLPIDVKSKRGSLASMEHYKHHNSCSLFVKVSANQYGYDEEKKILTIPLYSFFLFAKELNNGLR